MIHVVQTISLKLLQIRSWSKGPPDWTCDKPRTE